jgi:hypothetical protein
MNAKFNLIDNYVYYLISFYMNLKTLLQCVLVLTIPFAVFSQQRSDINYDESKVPQYTLPDPLKLNNGKLVTDTNTWIKKRRPELLKLFQQEVYGKSPSPKRIEYEITSIRTNALNGKAIRKEITIRLAGNKKWEGMDMLLYIPATGDRPFPTFLGLNFLGNHAVTTETDVKLNQRWARNNEKAGIINNRATELTRGKEADRWQIEKIIERGYAVATIYYGDIEPDHKDGWKTGLRAALSTKGAETVFKPDQWGAISAWAWGLSRALDYLEKDKDIDSKRVAVIGHSRLGKTALWAGAQDERFAIVISNDSGEGGAALARRRFGETTEVINRNFPHWFCENFKKYSNKEDKLPVDQHELIALIAPRPVYIASASEDLWADPRGEFLSAKAAEPVYKLFGKDGLGTDEMPSKNTPVGNYIGYHLREGKHDITAYDWEQYLNFADKFFKKK